MCLENFWSTDHYYTFQFRCSLTLILILILILTVVVIVIVIVIVILILIIVILTLILILIFILIPLKKLFIRAIMETCVFPQIGSITFPIVIKLFWATDDRLSLSTDAVLCTAKGAKNAAQTQNRWLRNDFIRLRGRNIQKSNKT